MSSNNENFWDHVDALRSTLIRVLATIGVSMLLVLVFYRPIFDVLVDPFYASSLKIEEITHSKVTNRGTSSVEYFDPSSQQFVTISPGASIITEQSHPARLAIFSPAEGLMTVLKLSFWVGMFMSSPIWLYWIYLFVAPALHKKERRIFIPFALFSLAFSSIGVAFSYYFTIPMANLYLNAFNAEIGQNLWGLSQYLNYTLILLLANAIAFEMCVILLFLVHFGKISDEGMRKWRPFSIVGIFTISAILTPPDVFTQAMLAIPLVGFYELAIIYASFKSKRRTLSADIVK